MAMTNQELTDVYNALVNRVQGIPTTTQIDALTDLVTIQHQALLDLVAALTARIQVLEDWRIIHMNDQAAHAAHVHSS